METEIIKSIAKPPEAQGWTNRRRAVAFALGVIALGFIVLSVFAGLSFSNPDAIGWPVVGLFGVVLTAFVVVLGGYMREARGEQADFIKNLSSYVESVGKAVSMARGKNEG